MSTPQVDRQEGFVLQTQRGMFISRSPLPPHKWRSSPDIDDAIIFNSILFAKKAALTSQNQRRTLRPPKVVPITLVLDRNVKRQAIFLDGTMVDNRKLD